MKISLIEAKKLATPGPYEIRVSEPWRIYSKNAKTMVLSGFGQGDGPKTNAAYALHCLNTHDELVETAENLLAYIGEQGICPAGCDCTLCSAKAALAKARTVEMP